MVIDVEQCVPSAGEAMWYASHIVVSEAFASTYTEREKIDEMLHALRVREDQTVIITRGKNGVVGLTGNDLFELPAYLVNVVDSTGCGDVFHGAYALALSQGQSVQDASQYASAASALSATQLGGRSGIPTAEQLAVFMSSRERS